MKKIFSICLLFFISLNTSFGQKDISINKYFTFYFDGNAYFSNPYQSIFNSEYYKYPLNNLFGYGLGTNINFITTENFSFSWCFDFNITKTKDFIEFEPKPQDVYIKAVKIYNLRKIRTGPTFFIGNKQQFEFGFNIDFGILKKTIYFNNDISYGWVGKGVFEGRVNSGYRYINKKGVMLRAGLNLNKGEDYTFYGTYFSLGYAHKKTVTLSPKYKMKQFLVIKGTGYLFDLQENIIGIGLGFEHFLYNTNRINIGYSALFKAGAAINYGLPLNFVSSGVLLFGLKENSKIDIEVGANIPLIDIGQAHLYQFINIGVGYRYINDMISLRIGTATTGILRGSIGFVIGRYKKSN